MSRAENHSFLSSELAKLSDERVQDLIENSVPIEEATSNRVAFCTFKKQKVFLKRIPLADLENESGNHLSTANLFKLPLFCQYRLGSPGFGAWRELAAQKMASDWVLNGKCANFPLLYHWRVIPSQTAEPVDDDEREAAQEKIEGQVEYWGNSDSTRLRFESLANATSELVIFLEYFPQNLKTWLTERLTEGGEIAEAALRFVDHHLAETNSFMKANGLIHFDAHFENILTDGEMIYFSDFGLALSSQFKLGKDELEFFNEHEDFDAANSAMTMVGFLIRAYFEKGSWDQQLCDFVDGKLGAVPDTVDEIIRRDAAIALILKNFFNRFIDDKTTPFPNEMLRKLMLRREQAGKDSAN
jgi:hypothetical protein